MKVFITKLADSITTKVPKLGSLIMRMPFNKGEHSINVALLSPTPFKVEGIGDTQVKLVSDTDYSETISLPATPWYSSEKEKSRVTIFNQNSDYGEFQITDFDGNLHSAGTDVWGKGSYVMVDNPILLKLSSSEVYAMNADVDLSSFKGNSRIVHLMCPNTRIHGDISSLANCTALSTLMLSYTQVSGDIASLANCTALKELRLNNTNVSGDIASLANCTALTELRLNNTNVSGDIANIVTNLTKLMYLGIPSTVTITDEQKKTLTDRGCTVTIV